MNYYIIIPTYNEEKFISLTLQSIVEQTVLPSKVVVVNDGSTDKTAEIVNSFVEKYSFIAAVNKSDNVAPSAGSALTSFPLTKPDQASSRSGFCRFYLSHFQGASS